ADLTSIRPNCCAFKDAILESNPGWGGGKVGKRGMISSCRFGAAEARFENPVAGRGQRPRLQRRHVDLRLDGVSPYRKNGVANRAVFVTLRVPFYGDQSLD